MNYCLSCPLDICDESNPRCYFEDPHKHSQRKYYQKLKQDPIKFAKYKKERAKYRKKYLSTEEGRRKWNAYMKEYRRRNKEKWSEIDRRCYLKKKEKQSN